MFKSLPFLIFADSAHLHHLNQEIPYPPSPLHPARPLCADRVLRTASDSDDPSD